MFQQYLLKSKVSGLIKKSIQSLYTENFNFNVVYTSLSKNDDQVHQLYVAVSMFIASELTEPYHKIFTGGAIDEIKDILPLFKYDKI